MCGIAGYWTAFQCAGFRPNLDGALARLVHRGPNDRGSEKQAGTWGEIGLGHTRLSIIDLSSGGHQPMRSPDGRYSLVFNGEIYNYLELRAELAEVGYKFRSQSDTEVLLTAWSHWGSDCLTRLVGMFAFVIVDRVCCTLTCVRDNFGIKPLFIAQPSGVLFRFGTAERWSSCGAMAPSLTCNGLTTTLFMATTIHAKAPLSRESCNWLPAQCRCCP